MPQSFYATFLTESLDREVERLRAQASIGWDKEHQRLMASGLHDGLTVAEIGSGPGVFADLILSHYPCISYTAIDYERRLLTRARQEIAPASQSRLSLVCASATCLSVPDNSHDFALARFVFQHLPDPVAAAREIWRILKPGGTLAIIDSDDGLGTIFSPPIPGIGMIAAKIGLAQLLQGGNRLVGRKLWRILREAGFGQLTLDSIILHSDEIGLEQFHALYQPDYLLPLVDSELITHEEWDAARRGIEQLFAAPDPLIIEQRLIACGVKPLEAA